ncbi:MAG: hypothetical protein M0R80_07610 [Proteobacteria bacterium]|jgi:hypothetical protein|nr:hypothetical protein [Pseudomonadota bacterium]
MKPYKTIKLTECPDVADIQAEGRRSACGKLAGKSGECRGYTKSKQSKAATRRTLKRADKARVKRMEDKNGNTL